MSNHRDCQTNKCKIIQVLELNIIKVFAWIDSISKSDEVYSFVLITSALPWIVLENQKKPGELGDLPSIF